MPNSNKKSWTDSIQGAVSDGGQVQKSRSNGALRRGRPLEKFGPELNFNVVESETLRESRRKYKILYVSSLKSSDISRQVLQVHVSPIWHGRGYFYPHCNPLQGNYRVELLHREITRNEFTEYNFLLFWLHFFPCFINVEIVALVPVMSTGNYQFILQGLKGSFNTL